MKHSATCAKSGTPHRAHSIEPPNRHSVSDEVPLIEFIPPNRIKVDEITERDVPKSHRFSSGPRLLRLELCLPGIDYHRGKYTTPHYVNGHRRWSERWFQCGNRSNSAERDAIRRQPFGLRNGSTTNRSHAGFHPEKWIKASPLQQPSNGELWYRATASRLQVSISLGHQSEEDDSMDESVISTTSTSNVETLSLLSSEWPATNQTSSSSLTKRQTEFDCPRYYYWDSGLLAHQIDVERSQLITEKGRIIFYLTLAVMHKMRRVWTDRELTALSQSLGYIHLPRAPEQVAHFVETEDQSIHTLRSSSETSDRYLDNCEVELPTGPVIPVTFQVTLNRESGQSLGLTLVEKPIKPGSTHQDYQVECPTGIFIKQLAPGGLAELSGQLKVHDQLLAINSVSVLPPEPNLISCNGSSRQTASMRTNHTDRGAETISVHCNASSLSNLHGIEAGTLSVSSTNPVMTSTKRTMMYPFAVHLLRQAIGPINLNMRRMVPVERTSHQAATEPESIAIESEHVASMHDEVVSAHLEPQSTLPIEQITPTTTMEPAFTAKVNEILAQPSSREQSIASTKREISPIETSQTVEPQSMPSIEKCELQAQKYQECEYADHYYRSISSECCSPCERTESRVNVSDVRGRPLNLNARSVVSTKQSNFEPIWTRSPKTSYPLKFVDTQRQTRAVQVRHTRMGEPHQGGMPASSFELTQVVRVAPDQHTRRRSRSERVVRSSKPIQSLPSPIASPQNHVNSVTSRTPCQITSSPVSPTVGPPSSGDHRQSCHIRQRQPIAEHTSARRKCKIKEPRSRHRGYQMEHHTIRVKSTNRLDSRLATLAKHIPQPNESSRVGRSKPTVIDADESRSFRELIANLNEAEWQALLHMVIQPDEPYPSPRVKNRTKQTPDSTKLRISGKKPHCGNQSRGERELDRGDGRAQIMHDGSHFRQKHH